MPGVPVALLRHIRLGGSIGPCRAVCAILLSSFASGAAAPAWTTHCGNGTTTIFSVSRPGSPVGGYLNTYYQGLCALEDCAVRVVTTVVSTCIPGQIIVDAGSKVFSSDTLSSGPKRGYGRLMEVDDAVLSKLNEEHGYVETGGRGHFSVGQVLSVIPNHVCTCINMHDEVFVSRGGEITGTWKIAARGKVR